MIVVAVLAFLASFLIALAATYCVRLWALRVGFVDRPGGHKAHTRTLALGGGIALMASVFVPLLAGTGLAWFYRSSPAPTWLPEVLAVHREGIASKFPSLLAILGGAAVLHVMGLIDDRRALGPWSKLVVQVAVVVFLAGPIGIRAVEALPAPISVALTVVWMVVIINAFNFLDNMDGLSAGVGAIAAAILAISAAGVGQMFVPSMAWVLVGALLGFLWFNFSPASIIMGDAGSLVVGYLLSVITILTTFYDPSRALTPLGVLVPVLVLAVPLYDVISVVAHRYRLGVSPFRGDRRHFSHRLVNKGLTPRGAVLTIYLATAATGLPAIVVPRVDWATGVLLVVQCVCVVVMIAILEHTPLAQSGK